MHDGFAAKAAPTGYKHTWESNQPAAGKFSDLAAWGHNRTRRSTSLQRLLDPVIKSQDDEKENSGDLFST